MTQSFKWKLSDISTHPDLQIRVKTDPETVDRYAQLYTDGQYLPPVHIVEATDGNFYLIDGHHRYAAAQKAGLEEINAVLDDENVTFEGMLFAAIQANAKNGLALTSKDRQRAAELLIINKPGLSLRQIAQEVGISKSSVENYIKKLIEKKSIVKCEFCAEYTPYQDHEVREWHPFRGKYVCPTCYPNRFLFDLKKSIAFHARNLHKCAKCGNAPDVAILENHEVYVECPQCGTKTDPRKTAYGAVEIWNSINPQEQDEPPIVIYPEGHEPQEDAAELEVAA
ncbi:MAG: ParB N-terminal domain-containing protein, partial [Planctomycetia bacterium]|nr:ParB N-terminal domain-containing protein [Planctomycetia bacterium]